MEKALGLLNEQIKEYCKEAELCLTWQRATNEDLYAKAKQSYLNGLELYKLMRVVYSAEKETDNLRYYIDKSDNALMHTASLLQNTMLCVKM